MARGAQRNHVAIAGALCGAALPALALAGEEYVLGGAVATIGIVSTAYTLTKSPKDDLENWLWGVAGALYLGGLAAYFVLLREVDNGRDWLLFTLITVWVTDTGAYCGREARSAGTSWRRRSVPGRRSRAAWGASSPDLCVSSC